MSVEILQISKWDDLLQTTKSLSLNSAADKLALETLKLLGLFFAPIMAPDDLWLCVR